MKKTAWFLTVILAVCLCLAAGAEEAFALKPGDTGDRVLELNTRLRQMNYTQVRASDQYTASTEKAVSAVQEAYDLPVTGQADEATLEIIFGDCYRPISYGDSGQDVKLLQEKLTELGYYWGSASGNFLEGTTAAVQTFQQENGLTVTGKADVKTQEALFALLVRPSPTPSPVPDPTAVPSPTPTMGPHRTFTKKLVYGSQSNDVQLVQQRLKDLGFFTYKKTTTGYYKNTKSAVEAFQKMNGLTVTGEVDEQTWNTLFNDPTVADVNCTPKPSVAPLPAAYKFEVDIKNQVVKVWKYNTETQAYTDLDRAFLCATGTTRYPTPLGTFTLTGRKSAHCKFPNWGGGEARWWTKITSEIAFHSVLYSNSSDDSTLKVGSLTGLGKRGSHGCIRLTVADAKWIYDHVKEGMQVWIHDGAAADPELRYAIRPGSLNKKSMMPNVTPTPPVYVYDGSVAPTAVTRSLSVGKEGQDVYWLQMKLKELGFYNGTVTGQYREGTKAAVKAYQKARGLSADGTAGQKTLQTLYDEVNRAAALASPTPAPDGQQLPEAGNKESVSMPLYHNGVAITAAPTVTPKP